MTPTETTTLESTRQRLEAALPYYRGRIPYSTLEGILHYVQRRVPPGGFLGAVLANDLARAAKRADAGNRAVLAAIAEFVFDYCPATCWGSPEKVGRWLAGREGEES